jgi:hypothetical protein
MSAKPVSTCSSVSHASAIFAYVPSRLGINVKKGKDNMVKLIVALNAFLHYFANMLYFRVF